MRNLAAAPPMKSGRILALKPDGAIDILPACSYVRVSLARSAVAGPSIAVLGTRLPTVPGTSNGIDPVAWWIRPDTWLVASSRQSPEALVEAAVSACNGRACAIVDVSDAFTALQIRGSKARELLTCGSGLDVRQGSFAPGRATRTRLAQLAVLVRATTEDCFELVVDRGAAAWLANWLRSAASALS